jgi:hypothetical protein
MLMNFSQSRDLVLQEEFVWQPRGRSVLLKNHLPNNICQGPGSGIPENKNPRCRNIRGFEINI